SDAVQQVVYIFLLSYGWYYWLHPKSEQSVLITKTEFSSWLILSIFTILTTFFMGTFFHYFTDADVPFLDATATALGFTAQYMIAKKKLENWILWMIVNLMYIGIYSYKGLYLYMILFTIYLGMAVYGYLKWRKELSSYAK
ncbi:MAG TPA: nicotinamide riboside transporter PnuC, partial [Bacteroidia bacterium]|nr:nicotinamide riboside transporter PnuC [Bacteroidia bacterium]